MDEVQIQSMAILTIRPELNVVQSKTNNDIGYVSIVYKIQKQPKTAGPTRPVGLLFRRSRVRSSVRPRIFCRDLVMKLFLRSFSPLH